MPLVTEAWFWSALLNLLTAVTLVYFAVRLTHGAGLRCQVALTRLIHRIALCFLSWAMLRCAVYQLAQRHGPSPDWFMLQIALDIAIMVSMYRHLSAPTKIPREAGWGRHIETVFKIDH